MPDTDLSPELKELFEINRSLAALIAPLQAILEMEKAPGISDRLNAMIADLSAIRDQMHRAADLMDKALTRSEEARVVEARQTATIAAIQQDIAQLKTWFMLPPEAGPSS